MKRWLHAEYRDFDGVPHAMLCTGASGTYYFRLRSDAVCEPHGPTYEVYRVDPVGESEACQSWFGLESRARERLPDIPVRDFPFDVTSRRFLPYDPIAPLLRE